MERCFKKIATQSTDVGSSSQELPLIQVNGNQTENIFNVNNERTYIQSRIDLNPLTADPPKTKAIFDYHPNEHDEIRRPYLQRGPYQSKTHNFPQTNIGGRLRRFNPSWFDEYSNWIEYSVKLDAAFCLCCYLFKVKRMGHGGETRLQRKSLEVGIRKKRFHMHVSGPNSVHNQCFKKCEDLMRQNQTIQAALVKQSEQVKNEYRIRFNASIDVARLLLSGGIAFRGHDESETPKNRENFLRIVTWYAERVDDVGSVTLLNAPKNPQMTSPSIQEDIVNACAREIVNAIIEDIEDDVFGILVDESRDVSYKEQMALVLRYVDKRGIVMEQFVGVVHLFDTSALSLKKAIYNLLSQYSLSPHRICGQGYDGASNMQGHINGLKALIMRDTPSAYRIHCFPHQLQLTLAATTKNQDEMAWLFGLLNNVMNVVGASLKRRDMLREKQIERVKEALFMGELETGRGLN